LINLILLAILFITSKALLTQTGMRNSGALLYASDA